MSRLPPAEKLPLALRKNIRDEWDNKKEELEKELSEVLTTDWTTDINPNALYPYTSDGYSKESLGSCIASYVSGAIYQLKRYASSHGESGLAELNSICFAHTLTLDVDLDKRFSYCGVDIHDGTLRIVFSPEKMGVNIDSAVDPSVLMKALNEAPPADSDDGALSFAARSDIRENWEPHAEELQKQVADILQNPDIKLSPNFEGVYAGLKAAEEKGGDDKPGDDWQTRIGYMMKLYYDGLVSQLKYQKFDEDELLREGLAEAAEKGEIMFRIVEKMKYETYGEVDVEDGILYMQTRAKHYGTNVDYVAQKLVDRL